jgi:FkbM family methyltransferase
VKTANKVKIATAVSRLAIRARALVGKGPITRARRDGIEWELDLREGIDLAVYLRLYERSTLSACRRLIKKGQIVLDVGANIGTHALQFARLVGPTGHVYAFEPTVFAFAKLRRHLELNPELADRITPMQWMLTDDTRLLPSKIFSSWPLAHTGEVHPQHRGQLKSTAGAQAVPLDEWVAASCISDIDVLKLDVDGCECVVLRGAKETLRRCRPTLLIELAPYLLHEPKNDVLELDEIVRLAGYAVHDLKGQRQLSIRDMVSKIPFGAGTNIIASAAK